MDLGMLIGLIAGVACTIISIFLGGVGLGSYGDLPSVFITVGGSISALLVTRPLGAILKIPAYFLIALRIPKYEEEKIISTLVTFSEKARREGLLALEDDLQELEDEFLRTGIQLVVDGTDPEIIKNILFNELNKLQQRHQMGIKIIGDWASQAPAWGMIGTLIGLVAMLRNMADLTNIGQGMATALITSFYGAIMAWLFFTPWKAKLQDRDADEALVKEIMIEGILSIQAGDNPRILEQKLLAFLAPKRRDAVKRETGKD